MYYLRVGVGGIVEVVLGGKGVDVELCYDIVLWCVFFEGDKVEFVIDWVDVFGGKFG